MLRQKTFLGIDIGSLTIKLVEMAPSKKGPIIVNYAVAPIPDASDLLEESDQEARNARIAFILKNILKEKRIKSQSACVSISGRSVFTRFVKMPFSDSKKLEKLITFEAQQQIPFPLEKVSWDYQIVGRNEDNDFEVLIAAIKQEALNEQLYIFNQTSIHPEVVDVGSLALYNSLRRGQIQIDEKTIMLDIGANPATMIIHHPNGYWVRTLSFSSHSITQSLMRTFNIPFEEAESLKFKSFIISETAKPKDPNDVMFKINKIVSSSVKKLYTEIMRSLSFYRTQFSDVEFDRLILSGGGTKLDGLQLYLSSKLKVTVDFADPFQGFEVHKSLNRDEMQDVSYLFGEALGLGLRHFENEAQVEINLLSVSANIGSTVKKYLKYYYIILFIIVLSVGWGIFVVESKLKDSKEARTSIVDEEKRLSSLKKKIKTEKGRIATFQKEHQFLFDVSSDRGYWLTWYQVFNSLVPEKIYLKNFELKPHERPSSAEPLPTEHLFSISLAGVAESSEVLDEFKQNILGLPGVQKIEMVKATLNENVEFELVTHIDKHKKEENESK